MFLESFCLKNLKISKIQFCPVLAAQSRVCQVASLSRVFAGHFWRLVRKWKVQSRGLLKDFRGSARDSLAGRHSNREKHLENFFQILRTKYFPKTPKTLKNLFVLELTKIEHVKTHFIKYNHTNDYGIC